MIYSHIYKFLERKEGKKNRKGSWRKTGKPGEDVSIKIGVRAERWLVQKTSSPASTKT